jgi:hypothetical protein
MSRAFVPFVQNSESRFIRGDIIGFTHIANEVASAKKNANLIDLRRQNILENQTKK